MSAKAEDRRLLIEEAAGITKFKSRKKQAERKMELTQQNLLRVGDIVTEIDRSLASLKRQAAKAERYVAYRSELEDLQLHEASHRYLETVGWIKFEGGIVEELTEDDARVRTELAAREGELEVTRLDVHAAEERLDAAQNASFAADSAVRAEEAAIERAKDRLASLTQRERHAEGEKTEMTEQSARLAAERDVVAGEVATLQKEESEEAARVAEEEAAMADLAAAHGSADARVAEKRQLIAKIQAEIASTEERAGGLAVPLHLVRFQFRHPAEVVRLCQILSRRRHEPLALRRGLHQHAGRACAQSGSEHLAGRRFHFAQYAHRGARSGGKIFRQFNGNDWTPAQLAPRSPKPREKNNHVLIIELFLDAGG